MLQKKHIEITSIFIFFSLLIAGTQIASAQEINFEVLQAPVIDGIINSGEYNSSKSFGSGAFELSWELIDATSISIGIVAQTTGWVAIGFDPTTQMQDADIIYAWVEANGTVVIIDAFSLNPTGGNHPLDTDLGGTDDILSYNGIENATSTSIEFTRLLSTGDENYDKNIPVEGEIDIIWAYGASDSFSEYHGGARGSSIITIGTPQQTKTTTQENPSTTITDSTPGFQGIFLLISLFSLALVYHKRR
ncbi:hypothetical protein CEE45_13490 [Candidatus Heimdallarchaeota archaeon B3_Heim]|nr:MAG: hypothetical protein CEE45_13490 [Candidatus Heimdallarchaeota archaeon B3_Heim]